VFGRKVVAGRPALSLLSLLLKPSSLAAELVEAEPVEAVRWQPGRFQQAAVFLRFFLSFFWCISNFIYICPFLNI
jgi:hypothetical protein